MSRILKRPMFRKGGEVMEGIMTGIKPRQNYALGDRVEEYKNVLRAAQGASGGPDGLSQFLIRGGMNLVSGANEGDNVLQTLAGAYQKPTEQLFASLDKKAQQEKQIGLQSAMLGIKGEQGMELARLKRLGESKYLKEEPLSRIKSNYLKQYAAADREYIKAGAYGDRPIEGMFKENLANFNTYYRPNLDNIKNFKGKNVALFPHTIKKSNIKFEKDGMMAGTIYYKPDQKNFMYERVIDEDGTSSILIYNIRTGEILKDTSKG
mgnify:FL=1|jgi:hypothetical protein